LTIRTFTSWKWKEKKVRKIFTRIIINNNTSTRDIRRSGRPHATIAFPLRAAPILFQCQEKGKSEAEKRNKVLGGLRRFIDGDSTLMASMAREEREEECQENRMRSIRLVIRRIHAVPQETLNESIIQLEKVMVMTGDSGQENQIKSDLRAIHLDLRATPFCGWQ